MITATKFSEDGKGRTSGVQTITICTLLIAERAAAIIEMRVTCLSTDNLAGGATRSAVVKRIAGAWTNVGDLAALNGKLDAGLAGATINVVVGVSGLELQVTGVAGKIIDWTGSLTGIVHTA